jgi:hypothetical protein
METNKKILGKINTQRCSVTLTGMGGPQETIGSREPQEIFLKFIKSPNSHQTF